MLTRKYEFQVNVSACYEPLMCDQAVTVLNQTSFDMKNCTYQEGFLDSSKFNKTIAILKRKGGGGGVQDKVLEALTSNFKLIKILL